MTKPSTRRRRCFRLLLGLVMMSFAWSMPATRLRAENRVIVRGNYYREDSTRVMQPLVDVSVDLPDERFTVGAAYMLDAITSASIASGAAEVTGGDFLFTEYRHESIGRVASRIKDWAMAAFFRYSSESDYVSKSIGVSLSRDVLERSGTVNLAYSVNLDRVFQIRRQGGAVPWMSTGDTNLLQLHDLALGYTHAITPTFLASVSLEGIYSIGPQENAYRTVINGLHERHPWKRYRIAPALALRWLIPRARLGFEGHYRFYADSWDIRAHAFESRVFVRVLRHWILRVRYRYYVQTEANFWRDDGIYSATGLRSGDPKMDDFDSHTPGLQVLFELDALARFRGLAWLSRGWLEATYNHVFSTSRYVSGAAGSGYGQARLGSLAFSLVF